MRIVPFIFVLQAMACAGADPLEVCTNGADDDGDAFVDCADQDCWADAACVESACDDGLDDDADGMVDCDDLDCAEACAIPDCASDGCVEDCSNGIDDDRDFLVDCADDDCDSQCDVDGDGWAGLGGPDCDDSRSEVNPAATEVPYDGLDNDCDPSTPDDDLDGDGFGIDLDCDDTLAATFPGAPETCGNGRLDDCDDPTPPAIAACFGERSFLSADARFVSATADGWLGNAVSKVGDLDGDGVPEFVMGMYGDNIQSGAAVVASAPQGGVYDIVTARAKITGESEDDWAAYAVAGVGQVGGGPALDYLVGAPYDDASGNTAGCVYVLDGALSGTASFSEAHAKILGELTGDQLGYAMASAGDMNGDGVPDVILGAPLAGTNDSGAAYVLYGPLFAGQSNVSEADIKIDGNEVQAQLGGAVAGGGDVDGDGVPDVVVGARFSDQNGTSSGAAFLFRALRPGITTLATSSAAFVGEGPSDQAGSALAMGLLDGDGLADVVVGAPGAFDDAGAVYVMRGNGSGLMTPFATYVGEAGALAGSAVAVADIDGDGASDLIVGAPGWDGPTGDDAGAVYVFFGPLSGELVPDVSILGERAFGFVGQSVTAMVDWTGDGRDELIIGAPFVDGAAPSSGEVGVFWWGW